MEQGEADRFWAKIERRGDDECWLWPAAKTRGGYGRFCSKRHVHYTHRLSWELTHGPIPNGLFVCHHCDVRNCVNPSHLFIGTVTDNTRDMIAKGRANHTKNPRGTANGASKLDPNAVRTIRSLCASGVSQYVAAARFGVTQRAVWELVHRRSWAHVE